jgi:hypothetical protein
MSREEAVARALVDSRYCGALAYDSLSPHERGWFLDDAAAAIRAYEGWDGR